MMTRFWAHTVGAIVAIVALGASANQAQAAFTLNFDDINVGGQDSIPNGYGGFDWNNFFTIDKTIFPDSGYNRGTVSDNNTAFNGFANPAALSSASLFTFNSAYLTAAWNTGLSIQVEGIVGGVTIYTQTVIVDNLAPTLFTFNYANIDTLRFTSFGGTDASAADGGSGEHFALDNATFGGDVNPTPAPAGIVLFGLGFAGMGMLRSLRKGKTAVA